jgi:hypothetical protein
MKSPYDGEMLPYERYKLYNWIIDINPKVVYEVGTGLGGGSTYYIAEALKKNNNGGIIYTCDPTRTISNDLLSSFDNIKFFKKTSTEMFDYLFESDIYPDFILFDGPENPDIALNDIKRLELKIKSNVYFSMHDWDLYRPYDNNKSTKSIKIREYLENNKNWLLMERLDSDKKNSNFDEFPFDSVGLCLYKFL